MPAQSRLEPAVRKDQILAAAVELAKLRGYGSVTRDGIAAHAGCSTGLVTKYFSTMTQLKRSIMRVAVKNHILSIIAQGLAAQDPHARKAPEDVKQKALATLA